MRRDDFDTCLTCTCQASFNATTCRSRALPVAVHVAVAVAVPLFFVVATVATVLLHQHGACFRVRFANKIKTELFRLEYFPDTSRGKLDTSTRKKTSNCAKNPPNHRLPHSMPQTTTKMVCNHHARFSTSSLYMYLGRRFIILSLSFLKLTKSTFGTCHRPTSTSTTATIVEKSNDAVE